MEKKVEENTQALTGLKKHMETFKRAFDERVDLLSRERLRLKEVESEIVSIKENTVELELEMASVTQEIAELKASSGRNHPMFKRFQESLDHLLKHTAGPVPEASSLPHIDNLANKLFQRIDQVTLSCQDFLRPAIEKRTQRYFNESSYANF